MDIMGRILDVIQSRHLNDSNNLTEEDKAAVREAVSKAKNAERNALIDQMRVFFQKGDVPFQDWTNDEKDCVNRIGFFKYGHLMSAEDVNGLTDANLKNDYECIKIKEENIVSNISDIEK